MAMRQVLDHDSLTLGEQTITVSELRNIISRQEQGYIQTAPEILLNELVDLLSWNNESALYAAAKNTDIVKILVQIFDSERRLSIIQSQAGGYWMLWDIAISCRESFIVILKSLPDDDERLELLKLQGRYGNTILHDAAEQKVSDTSNLKISALKDILKPGTVLSSEQIFHLLSMTNNYDETPFQSADEAGNMRALDFLIDALVGVIETIDESDRELLLRRITMTVSLNVEQIQKLSPHSLHYIIPHKQNRSKRHALILYSPDRRRGAEAEADDLENALQTMGCEVTRHEWHCSDELEHNIESAMRVIVKDCSLLIVCLMSHGSRGILTGGDGTEEIPVNDILHQLDTFLPNETPLVVLIQACQAAAISSSSTAAGQAAPTQDPMPTQLSDPFRSQHISLTRPHTVLLLATVRGGLAYRGLFTAEMAREFRSADGKKTVYDMFTLASNKVGRKCNELRCETEQTPKCASTLKRSLILPSVTCFGAIA